MNQDKVSNLFGYLKDKYGEDCVILLRHLEFTIKKMVDNRINRRFTLRCIKARITPVSCKIKIPSEAKQLKVITSYTKWKNNYYIKELET